MESWSPNPYFNMATIRNADMFFGRINLLRRFYETLANRQSISLIGPRHIGKSSFLWSACLSQMQARFDFDLSHHIFVLLDLREYLDKTCEDFFHNVSKEIILQSRRLPGLTLQAEGRGEEEFSHILDQIEEQGYFPVLLLDAFDNITRNQYFGPEFFSFLRAHATVGKVSYVTASIAPLYEVCHRGIVDSPFFNIFYTYHLEALAFEEVQELIVVPAQRVGVPFTDTEVDWVLKMAGRHPFFIQRVCYILFQEKLQLDNGKVDILDVRNLAYKDLLPHFQDTWERLPEAQRTILQDEAQQKGNEHRELPELSESAFFRQYVRNTCDVGLFRLTANELEAVLGKINDPKALGETDLRLLKIVSHRLRSDMVPSAVERGMAIRGILNEALDRLRGPGVRTDSTPEWRLYNILYYRFYRHHLKNEQIAARLEYTSLRKYFRERTRAIEALLNALFEMENALNVDE